MANIRMQKQRTKRWTATVSSGGSLRDITNDRIVITAKDTYSRTDGQALFQLSSTLGSTGVTITNPTRGEYRITISPNETSSCPDKRTVYPYDIVIFYSTGEIFQLESGLLVVEPIVTGATN